MAKAWKPINYSNSLAFAPQTYTPSDVGCYAESSRGKYLTDRVVEIANDHGASIEHVCPKSYASGTVFCPNWDSFAYCYSRSKYADKANDYMNKHHQVDGCYWGFIDGDWGLWTDSED